MTKPSFNSDVSVGNVISWLVLLLGLAVSYGKMQEVQAAGQREQAAIRKEVDDVRGRYEKLVSTIIEDNKRFATDLNELKVDLAVVKTTVLSHTQSQKSD